MSAARPATAACFLWESVAPGQAAGKNTIERSFFEFGGASRLLLALRFAQLPADSLLPLLTGKKGFLSLSLSLSLSCSFFVRLLFVLSLLLLFFVALMGSAPWSAGPGPLWSILDTAQLLVTLRSLRIIKKTLTQKSCSPNYERERERERERETDSMRV